MSPFATYPSLRDRAVIVTGGASGIGASIVEHFVAQGSRVGMIDFDRDASAALAESLGGDAGRLHTVIADLRDIAALRKAVEEIRGAIGRIGVLVNNAARDDRHPIDTVTPEYWDERMAANLRHQFFAAQAVKNDMIALGHGSIINMSSISFKLGQGGMPAYTAAKAAVIGLTRGLARDLGPHGIRCNSVLPGWIMTERQIKLWLTPEAEAGLLKGQCIPEKLYPPDIARMVLWLAADDSRLVTNQEFTVDGGWT
ncbi:MAG: SDR family oxidoreductase [Alphaproteobacteria bacterium]|nr:SDR family oxidoreductase [Alphaproteobacteria bacterium]